MGRFFCKFFLMLLLVVGADRLVGALLKTGLDRYFGLQNGAEVLLVGHSHTMLGIDTELLEQALGVTVAKYAVNGANVFDRLAMLRHFLGANPGKVKLVVYDVDDRAFTGEGMSSNSYRLFYPYIDNADMRKYLQDNAGTSEEFFCRKYLWSLRFNATDLNLALRGLFDIRDNFKSGKVDIPSLREDIRADRQVAIKIDPQYREAFDETVRLVRSYNTRLVLCYIPTVDLLSQMDQSGHENVVKIFSNYDKNDEEVKFLCFQESFGSRYELFADAVHLNRDGKKIFTEMLAMKLSDSEWR